MKRWPLGFLLVLALSAHAESFWDGNAAVQRGDAAFEAGLFAVSDAFARDTEIVIVDLASGKTTTARVTGRIDDRLDILVLLSPAAALPLGLEAGDVAFVRVTIRKPDAGSAPILAEDTAPSTDPDRIPAPVKGEAATAPAVETAKASETAEAVATAPAEAGEAAVHEEAAEAPAGTAEDIVTSAADAAFLAELAARSPQKQLYLPPREDEMFAYQKPVEPPAAASAGTVEVAEQPEETAATAVEVTAASRPEIASDAGPSEPVGTSGPIALAEAQPPLPELVETLAAAAPEPEAESGEPVAEPAATVTGTAAAAGPAAEPQETKPEEVVAAAAPVAKPAESAVAATPVTKPEEAPAAAAVKPAAVPTVLDLPGTGSFTWYLQLAAYSNEALAKGTAARLSPTYPVLVLAPPAGSKPLYRVFIGPLNRAESGTLLAYFRYRGFPDAFVRTAQK